MTQNKPRIHLRKWTRLVHSQKIVSTTYVHSDLRYYRPSHDLAVYRVSHRPNSANNFIGALESNRDNK